MVVYPAIVVAALAMVPAAVCAQQSPAWDTADDFAKVCVSALLVPGDLTNALTDRGMSPMTTPFMPQDMLSTIYTSSNRARTVTVTQQLYSDLKITNCITTVSKSSTRAEFEDLRSRLESDRRVGKLEGRILDGAPSVRIAMLKRPGNSPAILFNFTTTSSITSLSMTRYDMQSGN